MQIIRYLTKNRIPVIEPYAILRSAPEGNLLLLSSILASAARRNIVLLSFDKIENFRKVSKNISCDIESIDIKRGGKKSLAEIVDRLAKSGYVKTSKVYNPGEFSLLGDVLSVWGYGYSSICRVSFFDKEVEKISFIDPSSRQSISELKELRFILIPQYSGCQANIGAYEADSPTAVFVYVRSGLNISYAQEFGYQLVDPAIYSVPGIETYYGNIEALRRIIDLYRREGYKIILSTTKSKPETRVKVDEVLYESSYHGFISPENKILVLTDYELYGKVELDSGQLKYEDYISTLMIGDYVVHEDHGVGIYTGIKMQNGKQYLVVEYLGNDKLYVPLDQSGKLTRYIGSHRTRPKLTKLNGGGWRISKSTAKKDAWDSARSLLQLYALRSSAKKNAIIHTDQQLEDVMKFCQAFEYEDTDDQVSATQDIIKDLMTEKPMDRLLVGDVAFGKTEIAMRAAYAYANAGYQVAVLAPTTVLVEQHRGVFMKRFAGTDISVANMSRFLTEGEIEDMLQKVEKGDIDIVIGTHSLLSDRVKFRNLGLVVIDEEQRFGVKHKEKLKVKRLDCGVLTMSATPIPRTLNMALSGIKDISVIATAPVSRKPIANIFDKFDWDTIKKAIEQEITRNGQVFYLHNRVRDIQTLALKIQEMLPNVVVSVAHGQMSNILLAHTMRDFVDKKIQVLVCTTIVENGLDMPNVNTLIIDDVEKLGLAQMYQIRGRIGRGDRQAYAYFLYKTLRGQSDLRLEALKEFKDLGTGYMLSARDMEIRGAGDILGKEQSGSINSVGYGLYMKLLSEAVLALKEDNISVEQKRELVELFR